MDPEWQCQAAAWGFYGDKFVDMPFHCQKKALLNAGIDLPWKYEQEEDPQGVGDSAHDPAAPPAGPASPVNLTPTDKPSSEGAGAASLPSSLMPSASGCNWDSDGRPDCAVEINGGLIDMEETGVISADFSFQTKPEKVKVTSSVTIEADRHPHLKD